MIKFILSKFFFAFWKFCLYASVKIKKKKQILEKNYKEYTKEYIFLKRFLGFWEFNFFALVIIILLMIRLNRLRDKIFVLIKWK